MRLRRLVSIALITPMATGAATALVGSPAHATSCLGSAEITSPGSGAGYTVGQTVAIAAQGSYAASVSLQVGGTTVDSGGNLFGSFSLSGTFTPSHAGQYSIAVVGNVTGCMFSTSFFTATAPSSNSPGPGHTTPGHRPSHSGSNSNNTAPNGSNSNPSAPNPGNYPNSAPQNNSTAPNLPTVGPDGSGNFQYPAPGQDPQVAPDRRLASSDKSAAAPQWGRSIAIALVLLLIAAHLTAWSRRQRMASVAAARAGSAAKEPAGTRPTLTSKLGGVARWLRLVTSEPGPLHRAKRRR